MLSLLGGKVNYMKKFYKNIREKGAKNPARKNTLSGLGRSEKRRDRSLCLTGAHRTEEEKQTDEEKHRNGAHAQIRVARYLGNCTDRQRTQK